MVHCIRNLADYLMQENRLDLKQKKSMNRVLQNICKYFEMTRLKEYFNLFSLQSF